MKFDLPKERINDLLLRFFGLSGLIVTILLATHRSKYPVVLGLYSTRYALLLLAIFTISFGLILLSYPQIRARLTIRPTHVASPRQTWGMMVLAWVALPVSHVLYAQLVPVGRNHPQLLAMLLMLVASVATLLIWRFGSAQMGLTLRNATLLIILVFAAQLLLTFHFIDEVPALHFTGLFDEIWQVGTAWKHIQDPDSFTTITPDRNSQTWFYFPAIWSVLGGYLTVFGIGVNQARFFHLLLAWLSLPFLYQIAKHLYGQTAAFASLTIGIIAPLHFARTVSHVWVATAISAALFFLLFSLKGKGSKRARLYGFLCGLVITSAVEGHNYGGAFAIIFCLFFVYQLIQSIRNTDGELRILALLFFAGAGVFCIFWVTYHIILPGLSFQEAIQNIEQTYHWERNAVGDGEKLSIFQPHFYFKLTLNYFFIQPFELVMMIIVIVAAVLRRTKGDIGILTLWGYATFIIAILIAHINVLYYIFFFPMFALLFGAWIGRHDLCKRVPNTTHVLSITYRSFFILIAIICLFTQQIFITSETIEAKQHRELFDRYIAIGQSVNQVIPEAEMVIAGDIQYYLGMMQRKDYWTTFSFTWKIPKYWPLEQPQVIIVTLGQDEGYSGLAEWLVEHEFQAIECYPIMSAVYEARTAILYALPELNLAEIQENCTPEMLSWLSA